MREGRPTAQHPVQQLNGRGADDFRDAQNLCISRGNRIFVFRGLAEMSDK